ncbi:sensor histidine kinase [Actinomyces israelii]|uniref:sensor histidine kinase n=1 Tax=Actinomyces israelii TaxID=1659 RepID=UPI0012EC7663|nr:sensor histidine kinase [Actinomyces israelii]
MSAPTSALTSSPPWLATGPHSLRMRRLVVAMAVATTLMSACFITPSIRIMAQTAHRPLFWALLPALLVPPLVAGGAVLAHVLARPVNRRRRPGPAATPAPRPATTPALRPTAAAAAVTSTDRVWQTALLALLVGYAALVLLAAWLPVLPSYHRSDTAPAPNPLVDYYVTAAVAATAVLPPRGRFAYVIMLAPLLLATYPPSGAGPTHIAVEEVALYLATCLGDMGVLTWLLRQADTLDEADARRRALLIDLRTEQSRSKARRLSDDFVHDHILSVLKSVPTVPATSPQLRRSAREALVSLDVAADRQAATRSASRLFGALSGRLRAIGGDGVVVSSSIDRDPPVPRSVAQAFEGAAAEALRNSLAHAAGAAPERGASDGVTRTATLHSDPDGVVVTISDDGRGFDPDRTPLDRHGITGSIVARMHDVGGTARIDAAPGAGTTVTLTWTDATRRPAEPEPAGSRPGRPAGPAPAAASPLSLSACMEAPITRVIAVCVLAICTYVLLLEVRAGSYRRPAPVIGGLGAMSAAALLMLRAWPKQRMPRRAAAWAAVLIGAANSAVLFQIDVAGWPGCAAWCTGAGAALCCGLLARDRIREAWAGLGLLVATSGVWTLATGWDPTMILTWMAGQIIPVCLWRAIARLSVALTAATAENETIGAEAAARRRAEQESQRLMRQAMDSVRERSTPVLTAVSSGRPSTPALCAQARMLEAELRDERRAHVFTGTDVVDAARAARTRGIDVTLLDDRGPAEKAAGRIRDAVMTRAVQALDGADGGRVIIRLLPPRQRPEFMSVVTADDVVLIGEDGRPVTRAPA